MRRASFLLMHGAKQRGVVFFLLDFVLQQHLASSTSAAFISSHCDLSVL